MKKLFHKKLMLWIMIISIMIAIAGCGKQTANNPKPKTTATAQKTKQTEAKVPEKIFDFATAELTKDNINKAIEATDNSMSDKITDIKINNNNVTVVVYDKDILSAKTYLELIQPNSADVFKVLFKNKNIKQVVYQSDVDTDDKYGNSSKQTAITCTLTKQNADKIKNWDNFKGEPMSQYYNVVDFNLAPESQISGLHKVWSEIYK